MNLTLTAIPAVRTGMLIRRPPEAVYDAFADPAHTTRFWFTKSSGPLAEGAQVEWEWEMYGARATVRVRAAEPGARLEFDWDNADSPATVVLTFTPHRLGTFVEVTETRVSAADGDEAAATAAGSTAGFTMALCGAKALLEHGIELGVVADRFPDAWARA